MTPRNRARFAPVMALASAALLAALSYAFAQTPATTPSNPKTATAKPKASTVKPKTPAKPAATAKPAAKPATAKPVAATKPAAQSKSARPGTSPSAKKPATPVRPAAAAQTKQPGSPAASGTKPKQAKKPATKPARRAAARPAVAPRPVPAPAAVAAPVSPEPTPPADVPTSAAGRFLSSAIPTFVPSAAALASESTPTPAPAPSAPLSYAPAAPPSDSDVDAVRDGINLARRGSTSAASERRDQIRDTAGQKLVEWMILRSEDGGAGFARYAAFVRANPTWPSISMIRRRAESQLWSEKREPGTVFAFFSDREPLSSRGKLAMARAALAQGDRAAAQRYVRDAWRNDDFSADLEQQVLETFGALLTPADHKARMHVRLYADDTETAMRAARRLGSAEVAIVQAFSAVTNKRSNGGALLDAVPQSARGDAAYIFARVQWLRRSNKWDEAAQLMLTAPKDAAVIHDTDEWWVERRLLARRMLDEGQPQIAYRLARDAARPNKENPAVEQLFTAGWIALRFVKDPASAARHFAEIKQVTRHPTSLARASYWLGRAAEASGRSGEARRHYEEAAQHSAAYYGQLAAARLGRTEITFRRPPALSATQRAALRNVDLVRAVELLYATNNRDLVIPFVLDLDRVGDIGVLTMIGEIAAKHDDARAMLHLGKDAIARGFTFDQFAFPGVGLPKYSALASNAERHLIYAIARQESAFNPRAVSTAKAMGLMQVTPGTGRLIAKKHGVKFDAKRLLNDSTFNVQMGSAELGDLLRDYDGNHVLTFVGYNAGRGRAREWVAKYGDPRDPNVDIVDWVERIPITETRNYVQRVMENMQVYRARFGNGARLTIEADMRGSRR